MTGFWIVLLILICVALLFKIRSTNQRMEGLEERLRFLEDDVHRLASGDDRWATKAPAPALRSVLPPPLPQVPQPERPIQPPPPPVGALPLPPSTPVEGAPPIYARAAIPPMLAEPGLALPPAPEPVSATSTSTRDEGMRIQ